MNSHTQWNPFIHLGAAALLLSAVGCHADDAGPQTRSRPLTASSPTAGALERYIVVFRRPTDGRQAVRAAGGTPALELADRNAVAAFLPLAAVERLRADRRVSYVEVDPRRYPVSETLPYGVPLVEADQVPAIPMGGDAGRIPVCVIDSGLALAHSDLAPLAPYVTSSADPGSGDPISDTCGHGTHVTGTLAAAGGNGIGVVGIGPSALAIHVVKVFDGPDCGWAYSSSLVAALDQCVDAGARVINMSLGGSLRSKFEDTAFRQAYELDGVLSVAAAGNDGNNRRSYPASYDSVISVAAVDEAKLVADFSQQNPQVELAAPGVGVLSTLPFLHQLVVNDATHLADAIEHAAFGTATGVLVDGGRCVSATAWSGAVVLCERGDVSFADKVAAVESAGGVAAVIYNNEPGGFQGTLGDGNSAGIPALSLSQEVGQQLVGSALGASGTVSSGYGDGYGSWNGTSMATPHVAGVAALIWSQDPSWSNVEIRDALTSTAEDLGPSGRDDAYGFGFVRAAAALAWLQGGGGSSCQPTETSETSCSDGVDNDCDGAIDAADPDCATAPDCSADGSCNTACAAGADPDCAVSAGCGDGTCGAGESCDGRAGTALCPADCDGVTNGRPTVRYCYVEGVCEGPGCP